MDQVERLISALTDSLVQKSSTGDTQKLTILDNVAVGVSQSCRSCLIHLPATNSGKIYVTTASRAANANDFLLPAGQVIPFPVDNVSDLHFYGTVNGDVVHILWRS